MSRPAPVPVEEVLEAEAIEADPNEEVETQPPMPVSRGKPPAKPVGKLSKPKVVAYAPEDEEVAAPAGASMLDMILAIVAALVSIGVSLVLLLKTAP